MKTFQSYKYIFLAFLLISLSSCERFLEVQPKNYVADELTIVDKNSAETALRGMFRALADNGYYGRTFQFAIYLQGGELEWGDSRTVNLQFIQHDVRADNEEVATVWSSIYRTINRANHVIAKVPGVVDAKLTEELRNQIIGEAYFVRALSYFDLARAFGGVQIVLTPTLSIENHTGIKRSSLSDTYAQVYADLQEAEKLLPETTNRVRATKKSVWALKARYHLYQKEWELAEQYATKVIEDTGNYKLLKPFSAFFADNAVATEESIFETSYSPINPNTHRSMWQPPANGGIRSWFPSNAFVKLINDPLAGGNRNALVAKTDKGLWYGNLYYRKSSTDPAYVIRIAELYLIRAEASAQKNKLSESLKDINAIRDRAGLTPSTAASQSEILLAIENERRIEFAFEPHRWFDLVRTERADEVLGITDPNKYLLPIPIREILVDNALEQNPGY